MFSLLEDGEEEENDVGDVVCFPCSASHFFRLRSFFARDFFLFLRDFDFDTT